MRISQLIFGSIFFILLLFSITTYINYRRSEDVRKNGNYLVISSNIVRQSNQFQRNILYMQQSLRGFLLAGEPNFLETYNSAELQNSLLLKDLFSLIPAGTQQYSDLLKIKEQYDKWVSQFAEPSIRFKSNSKTDYNSSTSLKQVYKNGATIKEEELVNNNLRQKFKELLNYEYSNREKRKLMLEESERNVKVISLSLTIFSIIMGFLVAIILARHITAKIVRLAGMADDIAKGYYSVQIHDNGKDELSKLTVSLNRMANILSENISLLQRKNKELDQFAYIVSHDLKAPLRGIDNLIDWIQEDYEKELPSKVQEYLQLIKGRISRSENLIKGILAYSKVGKEVLYKENVNVNLLVNEVVESLPIHDRIKLNIQKEMPSVYCEKLPLVQVFSNLISNAIKYNDKSVAEIEVYCNKKDDYYEFSVADNGPGIPKVYHEKVFVIFQTLQERDIFESTGVGLAIVKKILDDRNEKISIISEPGKGSIFTFTWSKQ